jgi:8-oxo-dGTP pyrophosphatase MutT (NUDIX family)
MHEWCTMVDVGDRWTGRTASLLQAALRMSNDAYARHLGIGLRTVASWHKLPDRTPNTEMQQILTAALEKASAAARERFAAALQQETSQTSAIAQSGTTSADASAHMLKVAIAIVRDDGRVLLVQRRGGGGDPDSWQFPAGMVKPGLAAQTVAARETLTETGVLCAPGRSLGSRIHPRTGVLCEYILCDYLSGEAENRDVGENVSVAWATLDRLTLFIPAPHIYPPVLAALGVDT